MANSRILVQRGAESKVHTSINDLTDEIFAPVYQRAHAQISEIRNDTEDFLLQNPSWNKFSDKHRYDQLTAFSNNIIAFCGERGTGKSSALLSFSAMIEENFNYRSSEYLPRLDKTAFSVLPLIDPMQLEDSEELMFQILNLMMRQAGKYKEESVDGKSKEWSHDENLDQKLSEFYNSVGDCSRTLEDMRRTKSDRIKASENEDPILKVLNRSEKTELRTQFYETVQRFMEYIQKSSSDNIGILVIRIDDLDLNVKRAYEIVEHVLRYFSVPGVAVLMAVKVNQLHWIVEGQFRKEADDISGKHADDILTNIDEFNNMANKYLDKLLPMRRRLFLPEIWKDHEMRLCYIERNEKQAQDRLAICENCQIGFGSESGCLLKNYKKAVIISCCSDDSRNMADAVLTLLYRKTGIAMPPDFRGELNYIIPRNMRELTELLAFLADMDNVDIGLIDIAENHIEREKMISNIRLFEEYFVWNWANQYITRKNGINSNLSDYEIIQKIWSAPDIRKNEITTKALNVSTSDYSYAEIINHICTVLSAEKGSEDDYRLAYAIQMLYTTTAMRLVLSDENAKNATTGFSLDDFIGNDLLGDKLIERDVSMYAGYRCVVPFFDYEHYPQYESNDLSRFKDYAGSKQAMYAVRLTEEFQEFIGSIPSARKATMPNRLNMTYHKYKCDPSETNHYFYIYSPSIYWTNIVISSKRSDKLLLTNIYFWWDVVNEMGKICKEDIEVDQIEVRANIQKLTKKAAENLGAAMTAVLDKRMLGKYYMRQNNYKRIMDRITTGYPKSYAFLDREDIWELNGIHPITESGIGQETRAQREKREAAQKSTDKSKSEQEDS